MKEYELTDEIRLNDGNLHSLLMDRVETVDPETFNVPDQKARNYLATNTGTTFMMSTAHTYEYLLRGFVEYLHKLNIHSVMEATDEDVASYLTYCAIEHGNRMKTITNKQSAIAELYGYLEVNDKKMPLVTSRQIRDLPVEKLEKYIDIPDPLGRKALSREEIRKLLSQNLPPRNKKMMDVCYQTGIRNRDVRELLVENINTDDLLIEVKYSKGRKSYTVPITAKLALELEYYIDSSRKAYDPEDENEYLFPSQRSDHIKHNETFSRIVVDAAEKAKIQDDLGVVKTHNNIFEVGYYTMNKVTPHTLRHSILTHLKDEKVSDEFRNRFAGHANVQTTLDYYTHIGESELLSDVRNALSAIG